MYNTMIHEVDMKLNDYLKIENLSTDEFGKKIGYSGAAIRYITSGRECSFRTAKTILEKTGGLVGYDETIPSVYFEIARFIFNDKIEDIQHGR